MFAVHVFIFKHGTDTCRGCRHWFNPWGGSGELGSVHLSFQCSAEDRLTFCCIDILLLSPKTSDLYNICYTGNTTPFAPCIVLIVTVTFYSLLATTISFICMIITKYYSFAKAT